jgi:tRNA-2-methylthio-N6-dimethylallyladenosine synthase
MMSSKSEPNRPLFAIETYGCQMNKYDSEIVAGILEKNGYAQTLNSDSADILFINTCSVRDHAEKRALGRIGSLRSWKEDRFGRRLGVIGCMAQRLSDELFRMKPHIDFVVGPDEYRNIPNILSNGFDKPAAAQFHPEETYNNTTPYRHSSISGWVAINRGCNNYCSYCIVPYTRGRERSRPADAVYAEITEMIKQGFREVTLLGQNVNSYNDGQKTFPDLLKMCCSISGLHRIRFVTSHPKDLSDHLMDVMAECDKICQHLHLPAQSGSNTILKSMNRNYTREYYIRLIEKARIRIPDLAISTDIMVGFPGETESDFQDTYSLMKKIGFEDAFTYRYSIREGTKAAGMEDTVSEQEKQSRLKKIITLQRKITQQKKQALIGSRVVVLPEMPSKHSPQEWMGKTPTNHVVVFPKNTTSMGEPVEITIDACIGSTLRGTRTHRSNV